MAATALSNYTSDMRQRPVAYGESSTQTERFTHEKWNNLLFREFTKEMKKMPSVEIATYTRWLLLRGCKDDIRQSGWTDIFLRPPENAYVRYYSNLVDLWKHQVEPQGLIARLAAITALSQSERISNRLNNLRKAFLEERDGEQDISTDSLRAFFAFLKMHPNIRYPDITFTPDGNVYCRWKGDEGALFGVEFLLDSKVGYVVFAPNPRHPGELSRNSGIDFVDTVLEKIDAAFGITAWVLE